MKATPQVDPGVPLQTMRGGAPILYGTLGAVFHLEVLTLDDAARLEAACERIWSVLGDHLRSTWFSFAEGSEPARRSHLDYVSSYPSQLVLGQGTSPVEQQLIATGRSRHVVELTGAPSRASASPYGARFRAEVDDVDGSGEMLPAYSVLAVTVPEAWPLDEFRAWVVEIAGCLRLRWGAAGFTYSGFVSSAPTPMQEALYAHARRHPGYDAADYVHMTARFHAEMRTVNWLTWVGPGLVEELAAKGRTLASSGQVTVARAGDAMLLQAGPRPERGDLNRLDLPAAYCEADAMVRPVRASDPYDLFFGGFPGEPEIEQWLRRFERRVT